MTIRFFITSFLSGDMKYEHCNSLMSADKFILIQAKYAFGLESIVPTPSDYNNEWPMIGH